MLGKFLLLLLGSEELPTHRLYLFLTRLETPLSRYTTKPKICHLYLFITIRYALDIAVLSNAQNTCHTQAHRPSLQSLVD